MNEGDIIYWLTGYFQPHPQATPSFSMLHAEKLGVAWEEARIFSLQHWYWQRSYNLDNNIMNESLRTMCTLGQSNYIITFSSTPFYNFTWAGSNYSLFIMQYYGILRVWLPGTAQIINKKEVWLAFQGNNEGRSGRLKQMREVTRN